MPRHVPSFLEASTKDELKLMMHAVVKRHGKQFHFFDFSFAKGKWVCWYEIDNVQEFKDKLNDA